MRAIDSDTNYSIMIFNVVILFEEKTKKQKLRRIKLNLLIKFYGIRLQRRRIRKKQVDSLRHASLQEKA